LKFWGFQLKNHIRIFGRYAMSFGTLESLMWIALAKIVIESLGFDDIWKRWMRGKDRRFRK
jgi:hypothetical protein